MDSIEPVINGKKLIAIGGSGGGHDESAVEGGLQAHAADSLGQRRVWIPATGRNCNGEKNAGRRHNLDVETAPLAVDVTASEVSGEEITFPPVRAPVWSREVSE